MSAPKNPDTIIVKNTYYPRGLTEGDIWNYYQKNKYKIIKYLDNRDIFFDIATDINKTVVRRKGKGNKTFFLNTNNYDEIITGRTLTINGVMNRVEDFGIIDIDIDNFNLAKEAAENVYETVLSDEFDFVVGASIKYTGKTSFHIICEMNIKRNVDLIRELLRQNLLKSDLSNMYTVESKRRYGIPNLDLSSNKINGGFISLHSLSKIGLPSVEVPISRINNFDIRKTKIK